MAFQGGFNLGMANFYQLRESDSTFVQKSAWSLGKVLFLLVSAKAPSLTYVFTHHHLSESVLSLGLCHVSFLISLYLETRSRPNFSFNNYGDCLPALELKRILIHASVLFSPTLTDTVSWVIINLCLVLLTANPALLVVRAYPEIFPKSFIPFDIFDFLQL